jgi:hypothetical protein
VKLNRLAKPKHFNPLSLCCASGREGGNRLKYALLTNLGVFLMGSGGLVRWDYRCQRVTAN